MDYIDHVEVSRHAGFDAFRHNIHAARLVLFTTKAEDSAYEFVFRSDDILMFGRESAGVPAHVAAACEARLRIPIRREVRSLNVATAATLAVGEALRQTGGLPQ